MEKIYDRINWHNNTDPALNETNLNRMDQAIDQIDDRIVGLSGTLMETVPEIKEYLDESEDLVERIETMTKNPPYIGANGNWYVFNTNTMQYEDSGIDASITVQIADITMLPYIDAPYVTNSGTNTDPVFHLYIPRAATISSVDKTQVVGNVDTYTMTLQDGSQFTFTVTNGTGSGDMKSVDYDPQGIVSTAGGIIPYGDGRLAEGLIEGVHHTYGEHSTICVLHLEGAAHEIADGAKSIHAEGVDNYVGVASAAHVEGMGSTVMGEAAHAEGAGSCAVGIAAHAEGYGTQAVYQASHSEGVQSYASQNGAHAEGCGTQATAEGAHAEGTESTANSKNAHAEGYRTKAFAQYSHAEGNTTCASGSYSHAEGSSTRAYGGSAHAEGAQSTANGAASHAEGSGTYAYNYAHSEGQSTEAVGQTSHAEGISTCSGNLASHAEGMNTTADGQYSHAEGLGTLATAAEAHAGGYQTIAGGGASFAHGRLCEAYNQFSFAIGDHSLIESVGDGLQRPRLFAVGNPTKGYTSINNELVVEHSDDSYSDIVKGYNNFSVDMLGNTFMRGAPFTAKGVLYNRLIANGDYYVLEDGAAYVLWTNTRMINNNAWRGAQAYFIVSPFAPSAYGTGASTTALAVAQHHQFSSIGTAGLTLKKDTVPYIHPATGSTCYHARIGIGSCVANCCVRYTLIKIIGSEYDMLSNYQG